jgi:pyridoxamine 5'-phosphate oxidase
MPALDRAHLDADPIAQFQAWFERASAEVPLAEAMTLATVDTEGKPDARMVLLKGFDERGFRFFTNYESAKGLQLGSAPVAGLVIYWRELDRQVRIRGPVERVGATESDEYFASRARESQIGAWASPQSRPIGRREELDGKAGDVEERFAGDDVPRPPHWGGYLVRPESIEFWQGQVARMHDRFRYTREGEEWRIERLGP